MNCSCIYTQKTSS